MFWNKPKEPWLLEAIKIKKRDHIEKKIEADRAFWTAVEAEYLTILAEFKVDPLAICTVKYEPNVSRFKKQGLQVYRTCASFFFGNNEWKVEVPYA